jgi:hypothetical protein
VTSVSVFQGYFDRLEAYANQRLLHQPGLAEAEAPEGTAGLALNPQGRLGEAQDVPSFDWDMWPSVLAAAWPMADPLALTDTPGSALGPAGSAGDGLGLHSEMLDDDLEAQLYQDVQTPSSVPGPAGGAGGGLDLQGYMLNDNFSSKIFQQIQLGGLTAPGFKPW